MRSALIPVLTAILIPAGQSTVLGDPAAGDAKAEIERLGGTVRRRSDGWEVGFQFRGRSLNDAGLAHVATLGDVVVLNLRDTKITDAGLAHLKGLAKLRRLHLERTGIGDAGLKHLAAATNLEYLNVYGTKVTDDGLAHLAKLTALRSLYVWQTDVTEEGSAQLANSLPQLRVVRGVDLAKLAEFTPAELEKAKPTVNLEWRATNDRTEVPKSDNGLNTTVVFVNESEKKVRIYWVSYGNELKLYGELNPGGEREQNTYSRNTWLITDDGDEPLGWFLVTEDVGRAVIPKGA